MIQFVCSGWDRKQVCGCIGVVSRFVDCNELL